MHELIKLEGSLKIREGSVKFYANIAKSNGHWSHYTKTNYDKEMREKKELEARIDALYTKKLWGFDWLQHLEKLEFEKSALHGHLKAWLESMIWLEVRLSVNAGNFKELPTWAKTLKKYYKQLDELGGRFASTSTYTKKHCEKVGKLLKQIATYVEKMRQQ
jgi:HD-GYP domain-containing protein (c-di-GMP phosphodiesterase class II)